MHINKTNIMSIQVMQGLIDLGALQPTGDMSAVCYIFWPPIPAKKKEEITNEFEGLSKPSYILTLL